MRNRRQLDRLRNLLTSRRRIYHGESMTPESEKTPEQIENERLLKVYDDYVDSCVGKGCDPSESPPPNFSLENMLDAIYSR